MLSSPRTLATALLVATALVPAAHAQETVSVPETARESLTLTLYQNGAALVADSRHAAVPEGVSRVVLEGLPSAIIADSAVLHGDDLSVRSQTIHAELPSTQQLLAASVGQEVSIEITDPDTGAVVETRRARVLAPPPAAIYEIDGKIHTSLGGAPVFDALPEGVHLKPTWSGTVRADHPLEAVTLTYLTGGLSWEADYIATLSPDGSTMDLDARATIRNDSGATFSDAEVGLVAGEVQRPAEGPVLGSAPRAMKAMAEMSAAPVADAAREQLSAFHLYTLEGPVDLPAGAVVQPALMTARDVPVETRYVSDNGLALVHGRQSEPQPMPVEARLTFENSKQDNLGMPLPGGRVRVLRPDSTGTLRLVGTDTMQHMAEGREVSLTLGRSFDVTAERVQTNFERLSDRVTQTSHRVTLRNGRDEAVTVQVAETIPGDWTMVEESHAHESPSAARATWDIEVPAKGETVLTYTVRTEF